VEGGCGTTYPWEVKMRCELSTEVSFQMRRAIRKKLCNGTWCMRGFLGKYEGQHGGKRKGVRIEIGAVRVIIFERESGSEKAW